jgi:UPF0716 protein FxsA
VAAVLGRLLLLFTVVPIVELLLLIEIGGWIGMGPTVSLVLATGVAGAWLARREGVRSWSAVQSELAEGRVPGVQLLHALLVVIAGAFLVTPGVLTDVVGLGLLVRPVRDAAIRGLRARLEKGIRSGRVHVGMTGWSMGRSEVERDGPPEEAADGWHRSRSRDERGADRDDGDSDGDGRVIEV